MTDVSNRSIVLNLNANWMPLHYKTVKDSITALCSSGARNEDSSYAIDIEYNTNPDGTVDHSSVKYMNPVDWDTWITLPIRSFDYVIHTTNMKIRVPTVTISRNFTKMPMKTFSKNPTRESVWQRDGGICQYTNEILSKEDSTVDHVLPKYHGGDNSWENVVLTSKALNSKKGHSFNEDIGLKLIKEPTTPKPTPLMYMLKYARHIDHEHFILDK